MKMGNMGKWGTVLLLGLTSVTAIRAGEENVKWQEKMHALAETMGELLPELVSKNGDPKIIEKDAKVLSELSHSLKPGLTSGKMVPADDADPSLSIIAGKFSEATKSAYRAIHAGNLEYGKQRLKIASAYCISCHTRHDKGPDFPIFPLNPKVEKLSLNEKAALYIATRQFDKGLESFESLIKDKDFAKTHPYEWDYNVRNALALTVKVKNDPESAKKVVDLALTSTTLPDYSRTYLLKWKKSIDEWKTEGTTKSKNEAELLKEMRRLMKDAKGSQMFPVDRGAEVQYLRASAVASDLLRKAKSPAIKAEGLLTVGTVTGYINNYLVWPIQEEPYYEACVNQNPHSEIAVKCFERFEEATYLGFTGSAGTNIPEDIQVVMAELKALAKPKVKSAK